MYFDLVKEIKNEIQKVYPFYDIKATPWQVDAGAGYAKLSNRPQILINLGNITNIITNEGYTKPNDLRAAICEENLSVMISIGKTNLADIDDFEVENISEKIIDMFNFKQTNAGVMIFNSLSIGVIDQNLNYWRHIRFSITNTYNIEVQF